MRKDLVTLHSKRIMPSPLMTQIIPMELTFSLAWSIERWNLKASADPYHLRFMGTCIESCLAALMNSKSLPLRGSFVV